MTPEFPPNPRAELEARLTAYLLGELPAHEAAAVRLAMDEDAELAQLCDRLKPVIKLVRATAANPAPTATAPSAPLKLSDDRRQKLLAHFKTNAPQEFVRPPRRQTSLLFPLAAVALITLLLAALAMPNFFHARTTSQSNAIINNLRQLDGAKQTWALENKKSPTDTPTFEDLKPYMGRGTGGFPEPIAGEKYVLGSLNEAPSAELDAAKARKMFSGQVPATPPGPGPRGQRMLRMSIDGDLTYGPQQTADRRVNELAQRQRQTETINGELAPALSPPVPTSASPPNTTTIVLPSEADSSDATPPATSEPLESPPNVTIKAKFIDVTQVPTNNWNFNNGSPNKDWVDGVSQLPGSPKTELEAKSYTNSGALTHGDPDWSGTLDNPAPANSATNHFVGGFAFGAPTQSKAGKADGFNLDSIKIPTSSVTNFVAANSTAFFDLAGQDRNPNEGPQPIAAPQAVSSENIEPTTGSPIANADATQSKIVDTDAIMPAQVNKDIRALDGSGEISRIPADKAPLLGDLPINGRLYRSKSSEQQARDSRSPMPPQQVQNGSVDLKDELASPSVTSGSSTTLSGYVDRSLNWNPATGNANVSNYASTSPAGQYSESGLGKLADSNRSYEIYRDLNRNGSVDQGLAQGGETTSTNHSLPNGIVFANSLVSTNAVKPAPSRQTIYLANTTQQQQNPAKPNNAAIAVDPETRSTVIVADDASYEQIAGLIKRIDGKPVEKSTKELAKAAPRVVKGLPSDVYGIDDVAVKKPAAPAPVPQPEALTSENSFSTFSLNVSDVAFKLAAASLEKGVLPEPAGIRSEEFINAFNYRDPDPAPGAPIGFAWERAQDPFAQNRDLVRFSVKTAAAGREPGRPLNIVLLLDNSGSMERADRVQIIHEALRVLATQLQPQDRLSVVTFARTARLWVDGVSGSQAGAVAERVGNLTPQGGTNLEEAMRLAYETARRHYLPNGVNRVVLLTDGAANLGNVEPAALKQKVEENRKQGIALDCFGIGWEGFNDDLLEVLSRNGDGRYGFLNTSEEAATDFAGQLAGALRVAASDVKVQVEFNPKRVTAYRQIGYAKHQLTKEQFRDNTVNAAQIGAAESGNALYTIAVNPAGEGPLGTVRVRFRVPGTSDYQEHAWELPCAGNCVSLDQASPAMRLAATAGAFSESLATSPFAAEVTSDQLLGYLRGVPEVYGADARPKKLEWMIRQVKSLSGK